MPSKDSLNLFPSPLRSSKMGLSCFHMEWMSYLFVIERLPIVIIKIHRSLLLSTSYSWSPCWITSPLTQFYLLDEFTKKMFCSRPYQHFRAAIQGPLAESLTRLINHIRDRVGVTIDWNIFFSLIELKGRDSSTFVTKFKKYPFLYHSL